MTELNIDLTKTAGKIKPMNAVNNGPVGGETRDAAILCCIKKP